MEAVDGAECWGNAPPTLALAVLRIAAARDVTSVGLSFADPLAATPARKQAPPPLRLRAMVPLPEKSRGG